MDESIAGMLSSDENIRIWKNFQILLGQKKSNVKHILFVFCNRKTIDLKTSLKTCRHRTFWRDFWICWISSRMKQHLLPQSNVSGFYRKQENIFLLPQTLVIQVLFELSKPDHFFFLPPLNNTSSTHPLKVLQRWFPITSSEKSSGVIFWGARSNVKIAPGYRRDEDLHGRA